MPRRMDRLDHGSFPWSPGDVTDAPMHLVGTMATNSTQRSTAEEAEDLLTFQLACKLELCIARAHLY